MGCGNKRLHQRAAELFVAVHLSLGVVRVLRFAIVVMVSLGSVVRLLMRGLGVLSMSGSGFTGTSLIMAFAFRDASRAAQQRTHEPQRRKRCRNEAERGADFRLSRG